MSEQHSFTRLRLVQSFLTSHPATYAGKPAVADAVARFNLAVDQASVDAVQKVSPLGGVTLSKQTVRTSLYRGLKQLFNLGTMLAAQSGNQPLAADLKSLNGKLNRGDEWLITHGQMLVQTLTPHLEALSDYGWSEAMTTNLNQLMQQFIALRDAPRQARNDNKQRRLSFRRHVSEARAILTGEIDRYYRCLAATSPQDAEAYFDLRCRATPSTTTQTVVDETSLIGTITSAVNGQPLQGAALSLTGSTLATQSDADGTYLLSDIDPGTYTVRCNAVGFAEFTSEPLTFANGDELMLDIALAPLPAGA